MKKQILLILSTVFLSSVITSCGGNPSESDHFTKRVQYSLDNGISIPVNINFFKSNPNVVYIPIIDYQKYIPSFTMSVKRSGDVYTFTNLLNNEKAFLNAFSGELSYNSFSKFTSNEELPHLDIYSPQLLNGRLVEGETSYKPGNIYTINLSNYNLKPIKVNNEYYLPLDVMMYIDPLTDKGTAYYDGDNNVQLLYKSNIDKYTGKKLTEYPKSFYEYSYNLFTFEVDLTYGLTNYSRPMRHDNNKSFTYNKNGATNTFSKYKDEIINSATINDFDSTLNKMFEEIDDGGHTVIDGISFGSTYTKNRTKENQVTSNALDAELKARQDAPSEELINRSVATFDDNTIGYFTITEFTTFGGQDVRNILPLANKLFNKNVTQTSKIKDVVIDIGYNGGGETIAEGAILSWICNGKAKQIVKDARDNSITTTVCQYDINGDGKYDKCDYIPEDVNIYILTDASYSAASALAYDTYMYTLSDEYKQSKKNIKFIGKPNYGGACTITKTILLPTVFNYHMSSNSIGIDWNDYNKTIDEIMPITSGWEMSVEQIVNRTGYINKKIKGELI